MIGSGTSPVTLALLSMVTAFGVAAGASVFARRKYVAEIRHLNQQTDSVAVATVNSALAAQQAYIEALEGRLTRAELAATRALDAERRCTERLAALQVQIAQLEGRVRGMDTGGS